jgi:hypothetical protein
MSAGAVRESMAHHDSGWRPKGAVETHNGFEVYDHGILPHEVNHGEVDGEVDLDVDPE